MRHTEAFVMTGPRCGAVGTWPLARGEVTIRVAACGLCQREFGVWSGRIPRTFPDVLGHEVVGVVEDGPWLPGTCVAGMGTQALADHIRVPAWQVTPVPAATAEYTLIEPLACALNAVEQDPSGLAGVAVVYGLGILGQFITAILMQRGRSVLAVDVDPDRRAFAAATGAEAVDPADPRLPMALRAAAVGYECTADEQVLWELSSALAPGSGLVIVAHHQGGTLSAGQLLDRWHTGGLKIRNAVPWTARDMAECVRTAAGLGFDLGRFPIRCGRLEDIPELLADSPRGRVFRHVAVM
jgi:threonine dehydrogenase-like Zn-dependent dehydrogenase